MIRPDSPAGILDLIAADPWRMKCLRAVRELDLPDWCIAAGFVRNAVWDALHDREISRPADIDLVFFDPADPTETRGKILENQLEKNFPTGIWSVKNQARMAARNGVPPYKNTVDGLAHWVETSAGIGVFLDENDRLELVAALGIGDLVGLRLRMTPDFPSREIFLTRIKSKKWLETWPGLRVAE